ncbi:MAG: hypothetical protein ACK4F9_05580 [Brevinematia bacterium]
MKESLIDKIKSLSSLNEIFTFIHRNNIHFTEEEFKEFEELVISLDQRGKWCILLAEKFRDKVDIRKIEDAVIKKDKTGQFCYILAKTIQESDKEKLRRAVYEKDHIGIWKMKFDKI